MVGLLSRLTSVVGLLSSLRETGRLLKGSRRKRTLLSRLTCMVGPLSRLTSVGDETATKGFSEEGGSVKAHKHGA